MSTGARWGCPGARTASLAAALLLALGCGGGSGSSGGSGGSAPAGGSDAGGGGAGGASDGGSAGGVAGADGGSGAATSSGPPLPGYQLVWSDEFDGNALDDKKWSQYAAGNTIRNALVSEDTVSVHDGVLSVKTYTDANGLTHIGMVGTDQKFEPLYGYFEARIHFDEEPGAWCAFWLETPTYGNPKGDPGVAGTEIDIAEDRKTGGDGADVRNIVQHALNWDAYTGPDHQLRFDRPTAPDGGTFWGTWHTYALLWTPTQYAFFIDGVQTWSSTEGLSHRTEKIHLTCEVDDGGWAGHVPPGGYGSLQASTSGMMVDWVRVWQAP